MFDKELKILGVLWIVLFIRKYRLNVSVLIVEKGKLKLDNSGWRRVLWVRRLRGVRFDEISIFNNGNFGLFKYRRLVFAGI